MVETEVAHIQWYQPPSQAMIDCWRATRSTSLLSRLSKAALTAALPGAWPNGRVKGLRARGGFEVDIQWRAGKLASSTIRSIRGTQCQVRYGDKIVPVRIITGRSARLNGELQRIS